MKRILAISVAACSVIGLSACNDDASKHAAPSSTNPTITGPTTVGHVKINAKGLKKLSQLGPTGTMLGTGTDPSAFVRVAVTGATAYSDVTPQQYVKATVGNEVKQKALTNYKVLRNQPISIPGAKEAYVMTLSGVGPQHKQLRQDVVAMRGSGSSETALIAASSTTNRIGLLSPVMGSLSYTDGSKTLGRHQKTTDKANAAVKTSLDQALKAAPK